MQDEKTYKNLNNQSNPTTTSISPSFLDKQPKVNTTTYTPPSLSSNTNKNLSDILNNPKTTTYTPPSHPNSINFLPISGPDGKGIGVTSTSSGTIMGVTFPGSGGNALSKPSVQVTNSTNLNSSESLQLNTAVSQPVYHGGSGPKVFAGFTFRF